MNGKLFPFRTKHKLYDSIIIPGYWKCDLDWWRWSRSLARHRRCGASIASLTIDSVPPTTSLEHTKRSDDFTFAVMLAANQKQTTI
jgi:hypothetical protein